MPATSSRDDMEDGMKIVKEFPREVRHVENLFIPMPDGAKLAARAWMPVDATERSVPAILEYIPYRKRDRKRRRDEEIHRYFAGHGYAGIRVDLRGSGDSDGVLEDEYLQQELDDGVAVIEWLAAQPWCDGRVGMMGISWGGFNALQIAAMRPSPLRCIITVCSTDDRYADDVHYMGGCLLGDNLSWASTMFSRNSLPPDPEIVGDRWREMWHRRLEGSGLWLKNWLEHQRRDHFWKHGSVGEDWSAIECPVMAVSGWADGYSNAVFRMLEHLEVPRLGLVGPWSHLYPHQGLPGPAIGFLQEAVRWWDRWLKGDESNGIMDEPMLRAYQQDSMPPFTAYEDRDGHWIGEDRWPSPNVRERTYTLAFRELVPEESSPRGSASESGYAAGSGSGVGPLRNAETAEEDEDVPRPGRVPVRPLPLKSPLNLGLFAGKWCSYSSGPDLPGDQRAEDGGALVFETPVLQEAMDVVGRAEAELTVEVDRPVAMVAVRLSDVWPDNKVTRVTYGLLNLTHRESHEHPRPLEPGRKFTVRVKMNEIAQRFPPGHRVRLSVSTSYWPLAWLPPETVEMNVYTGESRLLLPVRTPRPEDADISFEEPVGASRGPVTVYETGEERWTVTRDLATDESVLEVIKDEGMKRLDEIGTILRTRAEEYYRVRGGQLDSVQGEAVWEAEMERGPWHVRTVTRTLLTSDRDSFFIEATLDAYEHEKRVFTKIWDEEIRRDLV